MPRPTETIIPDANVWASDDAAIKGLPADITRTLGWTSEYADDASDDVPRVETFNSVLNELYALAAYLSRRGVPEWHGTIPYETGDTVIGSDGRLYQAVQDGTNEDPTADADDSHWIQVGRALIPDPDGTVGSAVLTYSNGVITLTLGRTVGAAVQATVSVPVPLKASNAEVATGTDDAKFVTPAGLQSRVATDTVAGIARRASSAEVAARTNDTAFVTCADVVAIINAIVGSMGTRDVFISTNPPNAAQGVDGDIALEYSTTG